MWWDRGGGNLCGGLCHERECRIVHGLVLVDWTVEADRDGDERSEASDVVE